jgi:hypothetical protein
MIISPSNLHFASSFVAPFTCAIVVSVFCFLYFLLCFFFFLVGFSLPDPLLLAFLVENFSPGSCLPVLFIVMLFLISGSNPASVGACSVVVKCLFAFRNCCYVVGCSIYKILPTLTAFIGDLNSLKISKKVT